MGGGSSLAARRSQPSSLAVSRLTVNAVNPFRATFLYTGTGSRLSRDRLRAIVQLRRPRHFDSPPTQHHAYPSRSSHQSSRMRRDEPVSIR